MEEGSGEGTRVGKLVGLGVGSRLGLGEGRRLGKGELVGEVVGTCEKGNGKKKNR